MTRNFYKRKRSIFTIEKNQFSAKHESFINLHNIPSKILKAAINGAKKVDEKLGNWDLVTEYDRKIEDVVIGQLKAKFPNHK